MKITKRQLAARHAMSDDETRYNLNSVLLEGDGSTVATDGHILITVSPRFGAVDEEEPKLEPNTLMDKESVNLLAKTLKSPKDVEDDLRSYDVDVAETNANGKIEGSLYLGDEPSALSLSKRKDAGEFPTYQQVMPKSEPTLNFGIDMKLLDRVSKAVKEFQKLDSRRSSPVKIEVFDPDDEGNVLSAIRITSINEQGETLTAIVMPMRL